MKRFFLIFLVIMSIATAVSACADTVVQMTYTLVLPDASWEGVYTGEVQAGVPQGYGVFVTQSYSSGTWHYLGEWVNGKMEGQGGRYWDSGKAEVGMFENNVLTIENTGIAPPTVEEDKSGQITIAKLNALRSAANYLSFAAFSYTGLIRQLEYEGYSTEEATYAADNCGADWNEQAAKSARNYLSIMGFSRSGLITQLKYEGFTHEQAVYGVEKNGL